VPILPEEPNAQLHHERPTFFHAREVGSRIGL
jgi:hypothetical protein